MISINNTNSFQTPKCIKRRSSVFEYTSKTIDEKKILLKNRLRDMKSRIMKRNKKFHEEDTQSVKVLYTDFEATPTPMKTIVKKRRTSGCMRLKNTMLNYSSDTSSGIIGDAFECSKNFLSSTIIEDRSTAQQSQQQTFDHGLEMINDRNLLRLKKTLKKLRKRNRKRLSAMEIEGRRACGCAGGEIFTSTSTNLRSLCHSTLNENEQGFLFMNSQQQQQQQHQQSEFDSAKYFNINFNNFYNYTKKLNFYNDINNNTNSNAVAAVPATNFMDEAILINRFNSIGDIKIWYV